MVLRFFILCQWNDLESHSEDAFLVVVADDLEGTHFGSVLYVLADAEAFIIVTYMNHTDCVGGSFGQTFHVETSHSFLLGDELHGHRQVLAEGFVHYLFYFLDLSFVWTFRQGKIKLAIDDLSKDHTIVIVAHRLSTIKNVDKIFFLDEGEIIDSGTFEHLFETNEKFKNMFLAENI